ncbi:MAG TPA: exodeoxyribonuclease VII small subunit [Atribacteraceae bacterium]|nr:exodeoxyribonuclease VII small subunit [Atribacteraceae bacterium]
MNETPEQLTYSAAMAELEALVKKIEQEEIPVDDLADKVKRAACLINYCKKRLKSTEDEVRTVLDGLSAEDLTVPRESMGENRNGCA